MSENTQAESGVHPLLGTGPEWRVTLYMTTVELFNRDLGLLAVFPKPYSPQSPEWWREQAQAAIAAAKPYRPVYC